MKLRPGNSRIGQRINYQARSRGSARPSLLQRRHRAASEADGEPLLDGEHGAGLRLNAADAQDNELVTAGGCLADGDVDLVEAGR